MATETFAQKINPAVPRRVPRRTPDFEVQINQVFFNLVRSISSRHPTIVLDKRKELPPPIELTKNEREMIKCLNKSTNPKELIEMMFHDPPSVFAIMDESPQNTVIPLRPPGKITVLNSPEPDIDMAKRPVKIPSDLDENSVGALELITRTCQNYLKAPKIIDGFSEKHINRRSLWVLGISAVLTQMTNDSSNRNFFTHKVQHDWDKYFQEEVWNNNRYAATRRDSVYMTLPMISRLQFPDQVRAEIAEILNTLEATQKTFKSGQVDLATDVIAEQCKRILALFI